MTKYTYEFVTVVFKSRSFSTVVTPVPDYRQLVRERAEEGWRLVSAFNVGVQPMGTVGHVELVFERPVEPAGEEQDG